MSIKIKSMDQLASELSDSIRESFTAAGRHGLTSQRADDIVRKIDHYIDRKVEERMRMHIRANHPAR